MPVKKSDKCLETGTLLPPGDAALTRRTKAAGDHWIVKEKKGRRNYSKGVWAPKTTIEQIRKDLAAERSTEGFAKRKKAAAKRRIKIQAEYVDDFHGAVVTFLDFHPNPHTVIASDGVCRHPTRNSRRERHGCPHKKNSH